MININNDIPILLDRAGDNDVLFLNSLWFCLEQNGNKPGFGVQQLAQCMGLGRIQLNRKLLGLTGYSPGRLIIYYKMQIAKRLLHESPDTIKEIAWKCGFTSHAAFCRTFSNEFKCSPMNYRDKKPQQFQWKIPLDDDGYIRLLDIACKKNWLAQFLIEVVPKLSSEPLSIPQLSSALCISPSSLNRKVKEEFDITPQRFIRDLRLQYASELLSARKGSVAEVAYAAGFFDPAHFCRCFKTAFGCQPSVYEENSRPISILWLKEQLMNQSGK